MFLSVAMLFVMLVLDVLRCIIGKVDHRGSGKAIRLFLLPLRKTPVSTDPIIVHSFGVGLGFVIIICIYLCI